jgi:hypothetical protein
VSERPVRLVLDTSAIAAYATTVDVGETISEVRANGAAFGLPVACLIEAAQLIDADILDLVVGNDAMVIGVEPTRWRTFAVMRSLLGRLDVATAFAAAEEHGCDVLTAEPELYLALGDDPPIIPIG